MALVSVLPLASIVIARTWGLTLAMMVLRMSWNSCVESLTAGAAAPAAVAGSWAATKLLGTLTDTATIVGWPLGSVMLSVLEPTWFSFSAVVSVCSVRL